jgi:hypothetical protein
MHDELGAQTMARAPSVDPGERARRRIVNLLIVYFLLLIFEGALRKWALPSYGQWLFFVRDPVVLVIYWLALRGSYFSWRNPLLAAGMGFAFLGLLMIAIQAVGVASGIAKWPILAVYGWRNYFLYIPLPFVIARVVRERDLQRFARIALVLAIPIAILVLMQFRAPPGAPINVGFGTTTVEQFHGLTVDVNHTRPSGPFTSDVGQKEFTVTALALLLAMWIAPARRRLVPPALLIVATCALLTCLAVSGSRGAILASAVVVAAAVASGPFVRSSGTSARAVLLPALLVVAAVLLYPIVFPEGYATFMNRWTEAQVAELHTFHGGVFGRALYSFYDFTSLLGDAPLSGYGMGLAGDAALTLGVVIPGFHGWAESDWARHIVDLGPVVGMAFILYRVALVTWIGSACLAGARRLGSQLPLLLFAGCAFDLLSGELTGNGAVNGFVWLFSGLSLAAAGLGGEEATETSPLRATARAVQLFPNLMR